MHVNPIEERIPQPVVLPSHAILVLNRVLVTDEVIAAALRERRGTRTLRENAVFHYPQVPPEVRNRMAAINLPIFFNPSFNGPEPLREFSPVPGTVVANDYVVQEVIGEGAFSAAYRVVSRHHNSAACMKIVRNDRDYFETGMSEVRVHTLVHQHDFVHRRYLVRMIDCFYMREHIIIITELLNSSVCVHYMHLDTQGPARRSEYYNAATIGALCAQMLDALKFLDSIGIAHCDVKSSNICIADSDTRQFKLIDLGSATLRHDVHPSYLQSRWNRAPEVMLGLDWCPKVDVWSLGCVAVEVVLGYSPFQFQSCELVLAAQISMCGPLSEWMIDENSLAHMLLAPTGVAYEIDPPNVEPPGTYLLRSAPNSSLAAVLAARVNTENFGDLSGFTSFVTELLTLDPTHRPSAVDAIQHEWIAPYHRILPAVAQPDVEPAEEQLCD